MRHGLLLPLGVSFFHLPLLLILLRSTSPFLTSFAFRRSSLHLDLNVILLHLFSLAFHTPLPPLPTVAPSSSRPYPHSSFLSFPFSFTYLPLLHPFHSASLAPFSAALSFLLFDFCSLAFPTPLPPLSTAAPTFISILLPFLSVSFVLYSLAFPTTLLSLTLAFTSNSMSFLLLRLLSLAFPYHLPPLPSAPALVSTNGIPSFQLPFHSPSPLLTTTM